MRLVIEVTPDERDAIKKYASHSGVGYSVLMRSLFRLALTGKIPDALLKPEFTARPTLNVTLPVKPRTVRIQNGGLYHDDMTPSELARANHLWERGLLKHGDPVPVDPTPATPPTKKKGR